MSHCTTILPNVTLPYLPSPPPHAALPPLPPPRCAHCTNKVLKSDKLRSGGQTGPGLPATFIGLLYYGSVWLQQPPPQRAAASGVGTLLPDAYI